MTPFWQWIAYSVAVVAVLGWLALGGWFVLTALVSTAALAGTVALQAREITRR
jgi:hypothetical protein